MGITHVPVDNREKYTPQDKQQEAQIRLKRALQEDKHLPEYFRSIFLQDIEKPTKRKFDIEKIIDELASHPDWRSATQDNRRTLFSFLLYVAHKSNKKDVMEKVMPHAIEVQNSLISDKEHKSINRPVTVFGCIVLNKERTHFYGHLAAELPETVPNKLATFPEAADENVNIQDANHVLAACVRNALRLIPFSFSVISRAGFVVTSDRISNVIHFTALAVEDTEGTFDADRFEKANAMMQQIGGQRKNKPADCTWLPLADMLPTDKYTEYNLHSILNIPQTVDQLTQRETAHDSAEEDQNSSSQAIAAPSP
jgi:hypothetical protein